jgi:hypothetical protein
MCSTYETVKAGYAVLEETKRRQGKSYFQERVRLDPTFHNLEHSVIQNREPIAIPAHIARKTHALR